MKTVLEWSASANKLNNLEKESETFVSLIMEELDPDRNGFIEVLVQKETKNNRKIKFLFA